MIVEPIASGGFGVVYRVEHAVLGRKAALKVLHAEHAAVPEAVRRFEREARAVNVIQHGNVVDIYDFGELPDGRPYFVMELLTGVDLDEHLRTRGRLSPEEALAILDPLCRALGAAHEKGIIHRDVKASNVFLHASPSMTCVKLLDFGVAKLLDPGSDDLSTSRRVIGTPASMAPEQVLCGPVDPRTDVYALGALAFHMLTGALPFAGSSLTLTQHLHVHARRPRPSERAPLPAAVDEVVMRAMAIKPERRYRSAEELRLAFEHAVEEPSTHAAPAPTSIGRGLAVLIDVFVADGALDPPEANALADLEAVLPLAAAELAAAGFQLVMESGNSALYAMLLPGDAREERQARGAAVGAVVELRRALDRRQGADARIAVTIALHVDGVISAAGGRIQGGELLRLAWAPEQPHQGVLGTPQAFEGLGRPFTPAAGQLVALSVEARGDDPDR